MERGSHLCVLTPIGSMRKFEDPVEDLGEDPGEDNSCDDSSYGDSIIGSGLTMEWFLKDRKLSEVS